jgi:hypothetical protein
MSRSCRILFIVSVCVLVAPVLFLGGRAAAQIADRPKLGVGEVNGNDVYVRSGGSLNHYPICKLAAGMRVTVLSERGAWYEILPPEGAFSLISGEYVDTVDNKFGVVNGNNVRVRAGSQLNNSKYTVQTMLSKGAEVEILGENHDGFLRIKPPKGATLWITRDYVELVPDDLLKLERETGAPARVAESKPDEGDVPSGEQPAKQKSASGGPAVQPSPLGVVRNTPQRKTLWEIDVETKAELAKPILERNFDSITKRYRVIAEQQEDGFARQYAEKRLEQIDNLVALTSTIQRMNDLDEKAQVLRRDHRSARAEMYTVMPPSPVGLDARGELRVSAAYAGGSTPRMYRLVDPAKPSGRTIGYVEVPSDLTIRIEDYLGRYVGVRASEKRILTGGVDPVPIYVVSEFVILEPPASGSEATADRD